MCTIGSHKEEVEVKLRQSGVYLGVRHPSGTRDHIFFLLEIFFRPLQVCYFVASSMTRGRVCNLLYLLGLASAVPRDSRPYFIVPILETPPTWRARFPYLYPPGTGWPRYTPGHWVPFPSPNTTRRATVEVLYPSSTRDGSQKAKRKAFKYRSTKECCLICQQKSLFLPIVLTHVVTHWNMLTKVDKTRHYKVSWKSF
jgi:hypothetical protein